MEFSGESELEGVSPADAWVMLSDPVAVSESLKGCQYITRVDDPESSFEDRDDEAHRMVASGTGNASTSTFEMESWMAAGESESGSRIAWGTEADIAGRIAHLGGRVINPVADRIVNNFFSDIEQQMTDVDASDEGGVTQRLHTML